MITIAGRKQKVLHYTAELSAAAQNRHTYTFSPVGIYDLQRGF